MSGTQHHILSNYPLSAPFRLKLEQTFAGPLSYVTVSELRQASLPRLIGSMRSLRGHQLTVATEDESSTALVPVLKMLASISRCKRLQTMDPNGEVRSFARLDAVRAALKLAVTSTRSAIALGLAIAELKRLSTAQRVAARDIRGRRIAYLNCNLWFGVKAGGSVGHISGVANALMDQGYELDFFTVGGRLMVDARAEFQPLSPPGMLSVPFETTYYQFQRDCVKQIAARFRARPPSFLYQRMSLGNYAGVLLSRKLRVPLVLEYNGSEAWVAKNWGRPLLFHNTATKAEEVCLRHAHLVVTVSDALGQELRARGVEPNRIVVYPNCIDPKMFNPENHTVSELQSLRAELGFGSEDVIATFVGTFGQWHGVDVLATAIRNMIERDREFLEEHRIRFLLVGDGQKMPLVRQALSCADAGRFVRLTGLVPQSAAPKYLAASDILLSPHVANSDGSAFFGSPTKLFEYMAMGKAIYASDLDQIGDILRSSLRVDSLPTQAPTASDARLGVLGRPGQHDDICAGIRFLATRKDWRTSLGQRARTEALSKYTWERHVSEILAKLQLLERAA